MAVISGVGFGARFIAGWNNVITRIAQAIGKVFDGIINTVVVATSNPLKLAWIVFVGILTIDLIFAGRIGLVTFLVAQFTAIVAVIKELNGMHMAFLGFCAMMFVVWYTRK